MKKAAPDIRKTGRQQVRLCTALATGRQGAEIGDGTEIVKRMRLKTGVS
jgi:hypothetical protein